MYPGMEDPDLGVFVADLAAALQERGHELDFAVVDRRAGGKRRYLALRRDARAARKPDVVWAHFLVPSGLIASGLGAPLVVTAHGQDVHNVGAIPGIAMLTRRVVNRANAVIAVSDYLRRELERKIPEAREKTVVIDSGVDLVRFGPGTSNSFADLEHPVFLAVGALSERKNVVRLADAFRQLGRGSLVFVGDGELRPMLERRDAVRLVGRVSHREIPDYVRAADVFCAPALIEPFGQAILEAMAAGKTVVATRVGGPPEFVTPNAGLLVDPLDVDALSRALEKATSFPTPNEDARAAAAPHDVKVQAARVEAVLLRAVEGRPV
jgi:glycosyltransferase involved in cell wall biosynthesis